MSRSKCRFRETAYRSAVFIQKFCRTGSRAALGLGTRIRCSPGEWTVPGSARRIMRHEEGGHASWRSANRSAITETAAQGNSSQFNGLDFVLPWFGTRRSVVQIHSPRPIFSVYSNLPEDLVASKAADAGRKTEVKTRTLKNHRDAAPGMMM